MKFTFIIYLLLITHIPKVNSSLIKIKFLYIILSSPINKSSLRIRIASIRARILKVWVLIMTFCETFSLQLKIAMNNGFSKSLYLILRLLRAILYIHFDTGAILAIRIIKFRTRISTFSSCLPNFLIWRCSLVVLLKYYLGIKPWKL